MIRIASVALPRLPMTLASGDEVRHISTRKPSQRPSEILLPSATRLLQHGVIPGSSQTKARESALQERTRPASCGLATMESRNGILCRTGRVVETDIDLCGGPDGVGRARGRGRFQSRGDLSLPEVKGAGCSPRRPRDRTDVH